MKIGEKILIAIRRKGITQKKLAEYLGVSSPSVARWIANESYPMVDKFIKMVQYLEMVEDFFPEYQKVDSGKEVIGKGEIVKLREHVDLSIKKLSEKLKQIEDSGKDGGTKIY